MDEASTIFCIAQVNASLESFAQITSASMAAYCTFTAVVHETIHREICEVGTEQIYREIHTYKVHHRTESSRRVGDHRGSCVSQTSDCDLVRIFGADAAT